jgi:hypothetical protein
MKFGVHQADLVLDRVILGGPHPDLAAFWDAVPVGDTRSFSSLSRGAL